MTIINCKKASLFLLLLLDLLCSAAIANAGPNVILIITDDQRSDQMRYMPNTKQMLGSRGIEYSFAHVSNTLCTPSRASIYTAQYNSKNGVYTNSTKLLSKTIFDDIAPRYFTGLIGKYLNSWNAGESLPALDWSAVIPNGHASYGRQVYQINGELNELTGEHNSKRVVDFAFEFLSVAEQQQQPFFLVLAFAAPHFPAKPDAQDLRQFKNERLKRPPSFLKADSRKPRYVLANARRARSQQYADTKFLLRQSPTLFGLDRELSRLYQRIDFTKTAVVFISDNGLMHGEHGLYSKGVPYQQAMRVPLFIRYDSMIAQPAVCNSLVAHIDMAATLYDITNTTPSRVIDGSSLVPTFSNSAHIIRESLLLEGWRGESSPLYRPNYFGILTNARSKLVHNQNDRSEFYDLKSDLYEMRNVYTSSNISRQRQDHEIELNRLLLENRGKISFN
jgi:N-acetylglucosamine-6-sulfatase